MGPRAERSLWCLAVAGLVVGGWGMSTFVRHGHLAAAYGSYVPWGLWIASYAYFVGLSAGAFLVSALVYVFDVRRLEPIGRLALLAALCCLAAALGFVWLDLGHPERAWRIFLQTSFRSVMGWIIWLYGVYFVLLAAELHLALRPHLSARRREGGWRGRLARAVPLVPDVYTPDQESRDRRRLRVLGAFGILVAIAFHGGVGSLFGVVGARPYWHTGLLPIQFVVGALLSGGALVTALDRLFAQPDDPAAAERTIFLGRILLGLLAVYAVLEWAEVSVTGYAAIPSHTASLELVLFGPYWWVFWFVHLGLGMALPILLLSLRGRSPRAVALAGALVAVTFLAVRLNIVVPGLAVEELEGLERAFVHPRLSFDYLPTVTEWLVLVWIVSMAGLAFLAVRRAFPILSLAGEHHDR